MTNNYRLLMHEVLAKSARPCIATHDLALVQEAKEVIQRNKLANAEIQFFGGVRDELAIELAGQGIRKRVYIPYGHPMRYLIDGLSTFDLSRHFQRILLGRKVIT